MKLNLSKIFNIKPNGGGYKTLKKLMGKYNIPVNEIKDIKKELVKDSSGGDVKSYYYKILTEDFKQIQELSYLCYFVNVISALYLRYDGKIVKLNWYVDPQKHIYGAAEIIIGAIAFEISDAPTSILVSDEKYIQYDISKGNIYDKFMSFGITKEQLSVLDQFIQEITKEEYESMITYKPE